MPSRARFDDRERPREKGRERDRDHDRDRDRNRDDRQPRGSHESMEEPPTSKPNRLGLREFWIEGESLNRDVLQRQVGFMLGGDARSKPEDRDGVPGFRITAVRPFTQEQLKDLVDISAEYEQEKRQHGKKTGKKDLPYDRSKTQQRHEVRPTRDSPDSAEYYAEERYGPGPSYQRPGEGRAKAAPPEAFATSGMNPNTYYQDQYAPGPVAQPHGFAPHNQMPQPTGRKGYPEPQYYDDVPRTRPTAEPSYYEHDLPRPGTHRPVERHLGQPLPRHEVGPPPSTDYEMDYDPPPRYTTEDPSRPPRGRGVPQPRMYEDEYGAPYKTTRPGAYDPHQMDIDDGPPPATRRAPMDYAPRGPPPAGDVYYRKGGAGPSEKRRR